MNDEDLLGYFEIHSRTERALFHVDMIRRLLDLADEPHSGWLDPIQIGFIAAHNDVVDPLVKKARERMDADNARFTLIAGFISEDDRVAATRMSLSELTRRAYGFRPEQDDLRSEELRLRNQRLSSELDDQLGKMRTETERNAARLRTGQ